ncbi:MAG: acyltransferase family protein [Dysgonomonas sp.]|nr:acyltransferase family protein [Dysgonomonas sp.]
MTENKTKDRVLYADIMRIVTIFAVVVFHIVTNRWFTAFGTYPVEWHTINIFVAGLRWCVPVFFMLSGMIFLDPNYKITTKKLYTKTIPRILIALIFWSIAYRTLSPITAALLNVKPFDINDLHRIYKEIFLGTPWHHLWFLYPLLAMYILTPLLRIFTANAKKEHYIYFLILYFVFGAIVPTINLRFNVHVSFSITELYSYTGYFIAGYFFSKFNLTKKETNILYILGILSFIGTYLISTITALNTGGPATQFFDRTGPNTMLTAFFIFVLIKNIVNNSPKILKYKNNKYITLLANCGFGIYLVHDFFNVGLNLLNINTGTFPAILSIFILSIFVYFASFGVVLIIRKIPILNKWII